MAISSFTEACFIFSPLVFFLSFVKRLHFAGGFSAGFSPLNVGIWSIYGLDETLVVSLMVERLYVAVV